ncbi:MAG TPA: Rieske (2Fe-2S) protein [Capsulimonadaceae bacterium]|nr:Rieske (2Fe-2S) protein [Capsulimonadaceae bacterium]
MSRTFTRRSFLLRLAVLGGAVAALPTIGCAEASGAWIPLGPASKFKKGDFTPVQLTGKYSGTQIFVAQQADNSYLALSSRCTHRGCVVGWNGQQKQFICPCHGGRFDQTGKNVGGPPPSPLPQFATRVDEHGILNVQAPGN